MTGEAMTIGQLAASADVHVETVRYYQRRGLLLEPPRPAGSVRRYGAGDRSRLQFIRRAQTMGFSLEEIAGLLDIRGRHACEQTRQLTELKLHDVRRRLAELHRLEQDLLHLLTDCSQIRSGDDCPTLQLLERVEGSATAQSPERRTMVSSNRPRRPSNAGSSRAAPELKGRRTRSR